MTAPAEFVPEGFSPASWAIATEAEAIEASAVRKGTLSEWSTLVVRARAVRTLSQRDRAIILRIIADCEEQMDKLRDSRILVLEDALGKALDKLEATLGADHPEVARYRTALRDRL